jgi:bacterioferritin (cytochrome b1)
MMRILGTLPLVVLLACACSQKKDNGLDEVQALHRGELAAVATYDQAIAKTDREAFKTTLSRIRDEHRSAADSLRARVVALGGTPATEAGPWGAWTKLVTGASGALGDDPLLGTLKTGEKHGIDEYEDAIEDAEVDAATKDLSRTLLAKQREHVAALEALSSASQ